MVLALVFTLVLLQSPLSESFQTAFVQALQDHVEQDVEHTVVTSTPFHDSSTACLRFGLLETNSDAPNDTDVIADSPAVKLTVTPSSELSENRAPIEDDIGTQAASVALERSEKRGFVDEDVGTQTVSAALVSRESGKSMFFSTFVNLFTLLVLVDMIRRVMAAYKAKSTPLAYGEDAQEQPEVAPTMDEKAFDAGAWDELANDLPTASLWADDSDDEADKSVPVDPLAAYMECEAQEQLPTASKEALLKLIQITKG